jgi:hypothetical protein
MKSRCVHLFGTTEKLLSTVQARWLGSKITNIVHGVDVNGLEQPDVAIKAAFVIKGSTLSVAHRRERCLSEGIS